MSELITDDMTVAEARAIVIEHRKEGIICGVCDKFAKEYDRKLHHSMALVLIYLYRIDKEKPFEYVDVLREIPKRYGLNPATTHYQKLRFWDFIEDSGESNLPTTKTRGHWRITEAGKRFVRGEIRAPHAIIQYNNVFLGMSDDSINIKDALGDRWSYEELMDGYVPKVNKQGKLL